MVAVVLINPKFPHNVGGAVRACAAFGVARLRWTGDRVGNPVHGERLPREERLRVFQKVDWGRAEASDWRMEGLTPVAVEVRAAAEELTWSILQMPPTSSDRRMVA